MLISFKVRSIAAVILDDGNGRLAKLKWFRLTLASIALLLMGFAVDRYGPRMGYMAPTP